MPFVPTIRRLRGDASRPATQVLLVFVFALAACGASAAASASSRLSSSFPTSNAARQASPDLFASVAIESSPDGLPLMSHPQVRSELRYFQGPGRASMNRWLERGGSYLPMIRRGLADSGLPEDLCWLPMIESGFSNSAVSPKGAAGMWQFMPATARMYGLRVDGLVDERRNPRKATRAALQHLADLMDRFESPCLAAAAYNAGSGRVERGLERLQQRRHRYESDFGTEFLAASNEPVGRQRSSFTDADFFRLSDASLLASETQEYVPRLIAASMIGRNPGRYGFTRPGMGSKLPSDSVVVTKATRLDLIASATGVSARAVRELNPEFVHGVTPPDERTTIYLPCGLAGDVREKVAALPVAAIDPSMLILSPEPESDSGDWRRPRYSLRSHYSLRSRFSLGSRYSFRVRQAAARYAVKSHPEERTAAARSGETLDDVARRCGISASVLAKVNHLPRGVPLQESQIVRLP